MYSPGNVPADPKDLPNFLLTELQSLSQNLNLARDFLFLQKRAAAPAKVVEGMVVLADGTLWNPGSGAGYYGYRNGGWKFLG